MISFVDVALNTTYDTSHQHSHRAQNWWSYVTNSNTRQHVIKIVKNVNLTLTYHEDTGGGGSHLFPFISALDGDGGSTLRPGHFTFGKEIRYPLYRTLVGPWLWSERVQTIPLPLGFEPLYVQPVINKSAFNAPNHQINYILTILFKTVKLSHETVWTAQTRSNRPEGKGDPCTGTEAQYRPYGP